MIVYSESSEYGGHEAATISLVKNLQGFGNFEVEFCLQEGNEKFKEAVLEQRYIVSNNFSSKRYPLFNLIKLSYYLEVFRVVKRGDGDLLLASGNMDFNLVPLIIGKILKRKTILYIPFIPRYQRISSSKLVGFLRDRFHELFFKFVSNVILIKESDAQLLVERGARKAKVLVVENSIRPTELKWERPEISASRFKIVVPGRLVDRQKEQKRALEILKRIRARGIPATMTFMGEGPDLDILVDRAGELGLGGEVKFAGHVVQMPKKILIGFDIVLFTTKFEGVPLTLLELVNTGIPIVATNIDVHRIYLNESDIFDTDEEAAELVAKYLIGDREFHPRKTYCKTETMEKNRAKILAYFKNEGGLR